MQTSLLLDANQVISDKFLLILVGKEGYTINTWTAGPKGTWTNEIFHSSLDELVPWSYLLAMEDMMVFIFVCCGYQGRYYSSNEKLNSKRKHLFTPLWVNSPLLSKVSALSFMIFSFLNNKISLLLQWVQHWHSKLK